MMMQDLLSIMAADVRQRERFAQEWGIAGMEYHYEAGSTQDIARERAESGAPPWTLVLADTQTHGRGQHGRPWHAGQGTSLMFSLLLRPASFGEAALVPIRTGISLAEALDPLLRPGISTRLKWPNDIIIENGKAGGILCESQIRGEEIGVIVGVGINVGHFPLEPALTAYPAPTFLAEHVRPGVTRVDILAAIMRSMRKHLSGGGDLLAPSELSAYATRDWLFGRAITSPRAGTARGITEHGHLIIETPDGGTERAVAGQTSVMNDE